MSSERSSSTRRSFLRGVGGVAGALAVSSAAAPAAAEHPQTRPAYVSLSYPESIIKQYQPLLILDNVENEPTAFHALYAESSESPLDVIVGFNHYLYQDGVSKFDSHLGDREPIYIYIDSETKEPVKVQYSAYHWYSNSEYWQDLSTDSSGNRAKMQVAPRHHQHMTYHGDKGGETLPVKNLLESYPTWLDNGLEGEIHPGAVYNPQEEMQYREYWWRDDSQTLKERVLGRLYISLGVRGAGSSDLEGGLW